ncbi:hypothetical protein [Parageobacillus thermoglucosidasius]|nr:hypothetical protein [Parageobacillus thermoglucosidasius]
MWSNIIIWSILAAVIVIASPVTIRDVMLLWREVTERGEQGGDR